MFSILTITEDDAKKQILRHFEIIMPSFLWKVLLTGFLGLKNSASNTLFSRILCVSTNELYDQHNQQILKG